jgi:hypothetical protein
VVFAEADHIKKPILFFEVAFARFSAPYCQKQQLLPFLRQLSSA